MGSPIPRRDLPHTAILEAFIKTVASKSTYATPAAVSFVRFEAAKKNAMTSLGDMKNDSYVLYIDRVNSLPKGTTVKVKDRITFGAEVLIVREVSPKYGRDAEPHHWEVALVGGN
jgi:hypothetical protein